MASLLNFHIDPVLVFSSGFLATLAITTVMSVLLWFGLAQVDLPIWVSRLFVADPVTVQAVGIGIHLTMGLGFAWVFALVKTHPAKATGQDQSRRQCGYLHARNRTRPASRRCHRVGPRRKRSARHDIQD
jgi:hypothetical protein